MSSNPFHDMTIFLHEHCNSGDGGSEGGAGLDSCGGGRSVEVRVLEGVLTGGRGVCSIGALIELSDVFAGDSKAGEGLLPRLEDGGGPVRHGGGSEVVHVLGNDGGVLGTASVDHGEDALGESPALSPALGGVGGSRADLPRVPLRTLDDGGNQFGN